MIGATGHQWPPLEDDGCNAWRTFVLCSDNTACISHSVRWWITMGAPPSTFHGMSLSVPTDVISSSWFSIGSFLEGSVEVAPAPVLSLLQLACSPAAAAMMAMSSASASGHAALMFLRLW